MELRFVVINFLILVLVLYFLLRKPLKKLLDSRLREIEQIYRKAEEKD